jgi:hypothetical protein
LKNHLTRHDDMEDAGLLLAAHHVRGGAHDGPEVHGREGGVAQHATRAVVLGPTLHNSNNIL